MPKTRILLNAVVSMLASAHLQAGFAQVTAIANGGTGATTAPGALANLGAVAKAGDTMTGGLSLPAVVLNSYGGIYSADTSTGFNVFGGTNYNTGGSGITFRGQSSSYNPWGMEFYTGGNLVGTWDNTGMLKIPNKIQQYKLTGLSGSTFSPFYDQNIQEAYTTASSFFIPHAITAEKLVGATGNRTAVLVSQGSAVDESGTANRFVVGLQANGVIRSGGAGSAFGLNGHAQALSGALAATEVIGAEMNTNTKVNVARKAGLHISDVDGSTGHGTVFDAGMIILKSTDSVGYVNGILFSNNNNGSSNFPIPSGGRLITAEAGTVNYGIDLSQMTFTGGSIVAPNFLVNPIGEVTARGFAARAGASGTLSNQIFNIEWDGSEPVIWIGTTRIGKITVH